MALSVTFPERRAVTPIMSFADNYTQNRLEKRFVTPAHICLEMRHFPDGKTRKLLITIDLPARFQSIYKAISEIATKLFFGVDAVPKGFQAIMSIIYHGHDLPVRSEDDWHKYRAFLFDGKIRIHFEVHPATLIRLKAKSCLYLGKFKQVFRPAKKEKEDVKSIGQSSNGIDDTTPTEKWGFISGLTRKTKASNIAINF